MYDECMKERFSASADTELLAAGRRAVAEGLAPSFSAWVNGALANQVATDDRLRRMDELVAAYEERHGEITDADMAAAREWDAARRISVRAGSRVGR